MEGQSPSNKTVQLTSRIKILNLTVDPTLGFFHSIFHVLKHYIIQLCLLFNAPLPTQEYKHPQGQEILSV